MRTIVPVLVVFASAQAFAQTDQPHSTGHADAIYLQFQGMKWDRIMPELGENSPEIVFLHVEPSTKATKLMIRVPKNFHVPKHWHTANETHTVVLGTFIMEHIDGQRHELGPGSFNYVPAKAVHQAWTKPDEGTVLFITVDGTWDVNWVDGPPKASTK
jgi:quercetin dioxygenase-like cupin family protein